MFPREETLKNGNFNTFYTAHVSLIKARTKKGKQNSFKFERTKNLVIQLQIILESRSIYLQFEHCMNIGQENIDVRHVIKVETSCTETFIVSTAWRQYKNKYI